MAGNQDLAREFSFLKGRKEVLAVLLFGSQAKGDATSRSDVDICVVAPKADKQELLSYILQHVTNPNYHLWLFEELPLYMRKEIMDAHKILFTQNEPDLYEYFYFAGKLWRDQEQRQRVTRDELKEMLKHKGSRSQI